MLVSGAALLLACVAFMIYVAVIYRQLMARQVSVGAELVGASCASALIFNDPASAETTIKELLNTPRVLGAWIYTPEGHPFAGFWRNGSAPAPSLPPIANGMVEEHWFEGGRLELVRSIPFQRHLTGYVYIQADLGGIHDQFYHFAGITLGVLLISLLAAFGVSWVTQRSIAKPIQNLSDTARLVTRDKNYAVRAAPTGGEDEISVLIDAFNGMLAQIQERNDALQKTQDQFNQALISSGVGTWSFDLRTRLITWDDYTYPLFGLRPGTRTGEARELAAAHLEGQDRKPDRPEEHEAQDHGHELERPKTSEASIRSLGTIAHRKLLSDGVPSRG